eukprot:CAMPEP_0179120522 /NCGR_PEP_ID=MMETSP0796-20121207/56788_1 /TAXON_ID=73915 /ORGANISM="Pyrodinium bahamense, Strain pbaha01" /LENGTH=333 /DNA_ID=CAMNT_0020819065 /DNA_START=18 /DNA_END=1019 /DNA_ORIENTATION=-
MVGLAPRPELPPYICEGAVKGCMTADPEHILNLDGVDENATQNSGGLELGVKGSPRGCPSIGCGSLATTSLEWQASENVVIIIDWDDTIFPTTWLSKMKEFQHWLRTDGHATPSLNAESAEQLAELDQTARAFLLRASLLGRVCCVTLSERPWQSRSMEAFMPMLAKTWQEIDIDVFYAREERGKMRRPLMPVKQVLEGDAWDVLEHSMGQDDEFILKKQRSMKRFLSTYYQNSSWKNVVGIGDSRTERDALQEIAFQHRNPISQKTGMEKNFRCKTVSMLQSPTCQQLTAQLQVLQAWLPAIVNEDRDLAMSCTQDAIVDVQEHWVSHLEGA